MKRILIILVVIAMYFIAHSQSTCQFSLLSNDTVYQDYIENIFDDSIQHQIIAMGTKISRDFSDSLFRGPIFKKFDYCGNILLDKSYKVIDSLIIWNHDKLLTNKTYFWEPIENRIIKDNNGLYCIVLRVSDTITSNLSFILVGLNRDGNIHKKSLIPLSINEFYDYSIRNFKLLKDNTILLLLNGINGNYLFLYFDENYNLIEKKQINLNYEISAIEEITNRSFICSAFGENLEQYKVFRIDSTGNIAWEYNPYSSRKGAVHQIKASNNKIIIVGSVSPIDLSNPGLGLITELNFEGTLVNEIQTSKTHGGIRFCSAILDSFGIYNVVGYIKSNPDSLGADIILYRMDSKSNVLWDTSYNFRSALGTSDGGYYNDYGGFDLIETKDKSLVTIGVNVYRSVSSRNRVPHNDAILIKTNPGFLTKSNNSNLQTNTLYTIKPNPAIDDLQVMGDLNEIQSLRIFDLNGQLMQSVVKTYYSLSISQLVPGLYILQVIDTRNTVHNIIFSKI